MPNNFKLVGDYYVSKAGSDSNNGLTPETPKRTIQAGLNLMTTAGKKLIIGAGVYSETLSRGLPSGATSEIYADGIVVLDGKSLSNSTISITGASGANVYMYDITIRNYNSLIFNNGSVSGSTLYFVRCIILCNIFLSGIGSGFSQLVPYFINSIYINQSIDRNSLINNFFAASTNSIIINAGLFSAASIFKNSYCDSSTVISINVGNISAANCNYNNIQGSIILNTATSVTTGVYQDINGRYYDLSIATSTGDGTIGNPYGRPYTNGTAFNFATHRILYPTFNANSISADPKFNNILKQDFSLASDSPMIARASDFISNIGGTYVATRVNASGSLFSGSNATVDNLVFSSFSDYVISGSAVTGSVTSAPIFVSSSAKVIQEIDYNGLLAFNKDTTAPTGSNQNVPDVLTYTSASGQAGASPDRLTYYMRWTTGSSQPATDAQWENGGLWPAGSFNVFEWNTKPSVDYLGRGNGDQNFNTVNTPTFVKATYIQLRMTLRNDYLI